MISMVMQRRATRYISQIVLFGASLGLCTLSAAAQGWRPDKPVEIVVGVGPGGPQDGMARLLQKSIQDLRLVPIVNVMNRPGGGGAIALAHVNQFPGDGHYLTLNTPSLLSNHILGRSTTGLGDVTPIAVVGAEYVAVSVRADSPIKSARDLQEYLRKDPKSLSVVIGTTIGTATHLSFAVAMKSGGVDIKNIKGVIFKSGAESMTALLGGHVDVVAGAPSNVLPHLKAGRLRMLAIAAPQRMQGDLATIPTWRELGVKNTFDVWRGLAGPRGMSPTQISFWDTALEKTVQSDEWNRGLASTQTAAVYKNSTETARHWKDEYAAIKSVLTELGFVKP